MPSSIRDIIGKASEKKQVDREMFISMIEFIFRETKKQFSSYKELSLYLPGLFRFFYGRTRLIKLKEELETQINRLETDRSNLSKKPFIKQMSLEELKVTLQKIDNLLERYEVYIHEKRTTKKAFRESKVNSSQYQGIPSGELQED